MASYRRIYAIGDIHGRADLLDGIVRQIQSDLAGAGGDDCLTVTLGDYVDRGPDSRGVIERLLRNPFPTHCVPLKGNHEQMFEAFLYDAAIGPLWQSNGGLATLRSYGVPVGPLVADGHADSIESYEDACRALRAAIPREHLEFVINLKSSLSLGRYFFCHAGVRPGVPLDRQSEEDLLWIRDEFLNSVTDFGKLIVHGHTPAERPEVRPNRINIDTGAFATGRLTCLVLDGESRRFLST